MSMYIYQIDKYEIKKNVNETVKVLSYNKEKSDIFLQLACNH